MSGPSRTAGELEGAVVQPDGSGNEAQYSANARPQDIVNGSVKVPKAGEALVSEVARYARAARQTS